MKRSAFRPKGAPLPREAKQCDYVPRPREIAQPLRAADGRARLTVPVPKRIYIRDERIRDACRALPCQVCCADGPDAGVTWAHSNQGRHGHGRGIKASDVYVAALCAECHRELDQGKRDTRAQKVALWEAAHARTVALAVKLGLWPADIPPPGRDA